MHQHLRQAARHSLPGSVTSAGARGAKDRSSRFSTTNDGWRRNPRIDDGRVHVADVEFDLDTRTSEINPWAGWLINANYEHGIGDFWTQLNGGSFLEEHRSYGRAFFDIRRYNRVSPRRQINARLVFGGWLGGDQLPLERRFSVGGIGTIPGFDFRREGIGTDVGQCTAPNVPSNGGAQCERVALAQLEYRHELLSELFDVFNRNGIRVRGQVFRVKPTAVAFVDAGRGWLVGPRVGTIQYPAGSLPAFGTYRTDVGAGLDLGLIGVYVAKAVSSSKEPANFFVRIRDRF
jgi:Outer membrane protein/protective antigen OMA87